MSTSSNSCPHHEEASLNAILLLQKQVFQFQSNCLNEILKEKPVPVYVTGELKVPSFILNRTLPDDLLNQGRMIDNEETTILGFLDADGKLSNPGRLSEFMLFLTRIKRSEHRGICIHIIATKLNEQCEKDFTKNGGLRIIKRWLKTAEECDNITEIIALVKLCKKLPFDEVAIREVGIGKVIRKLLKFQSPSGGDTSILSSQVESLMSLWRSKQQEAVAAGVGGNSNDKIVLNAPPTALVKAISERLVSQRGNPETKDHTSTITSTTATSSSHTLSHLDKNDNKNGRLANLTKEENITTTPMEVDPVPKSLDFPPPHSRNETVLPTALPNLLQHAIEFNNANNKTNENTIPTTNTAVAPTTTAAAPVVVPLPTRVPITIRERKPLDMAESARKLLAMRAASATAAATTTTTSNEGGVGGEDTTTTTNNTDGTSHLLSQSASNVLNILSAVGKARNLPGMHDQTPVIPLKSALKKQTNINNNNDTTTTTTTSDDNSNNNNNSTNNNEENKSKKLKKPKKAIHWADENGGLLREVQIIEVAKIKRSTAHYSSTRELSKRERLAEKETHLSKTEDAMQRNTEWRTPQPLVLSIVVLDNISIVADSAEKAAQEKRLEHLLEVRYIDDPHIPIDPDEAPSVYEVPTSSRSSDSFNAGTGAGDDTEACAPIPWYAPGTEPPPEELLPPPPATDATGLGGDGSAGSVDDNALTAVISQLPPSLQALDVNMLRLLVQDPTLLQSIIRPDGSVDEMNLAALLRSVHSGGMGMGGNHFNAGIPFVGESGAPRRSRWGGGDAAPTMSNPLHAPGMGGDLYGLYPPPPPQFEFDYDYDPYGTARGGSGFGERPPLPTAAAPSWEYPQESAATAASRLNAQTQKRFPSTKASTPCRFFNTAKGCQFGDKCSFGHFLGMVNEFSNGAASTGPGRKFGVPAAPAMGPGMGLHVPGLGMGPGMGPGSRMYPSPGQNMVPAPPLPGTTTSTGGEDNNTTGTGSEQPTTTVRKRRFH